MLSFDGTVKNGLRYFYINKRYKSGKQNNFLFNDFGARPYDRTEISHPNAPLSNFMDYCGSWPPSRFHSTHWFCFTPAQEKKVKRPRSPCQVSCVSVWPVLAVLRLCFLADKYRQQELCFSASQSKKVSVHSALRFGLSHSSGWEGYLVFCNLTRTKREPEESWLHSWCYLWHNERDFGDRLVAGFLLWDTMKQFFEPLHILENYLLS